MSPGREVRRRLWGLEPRSGSGLARLIGRVVGDHRTVEVHDLLEEFSEFGGDFLAAELGLRALVGFLVLLLCSRSGSGSSPTIRPCGPRWSCAADLVPGLDASVTAMLHDLWSGRATYSILALVGLAWTTGGVYGALDDAVHRVFPGRLAPRHARTARARHPGGRAQFRGVGMLLALSAAWCALEANLLPADGIAWRVVSPVGGAALVTLVILAVYRPVPTAPPTLRKAGQPAVVAGVTVAAMTSTYALIALRLVGVLSVFGAVAVVIGTLLWLARVFRVIRLAGLWAS